MSAEIRTVREALDAPAAAAVRALARRAAEDDGVEALSEQPLLWLSAEAPVVHLLAQDGDALLGYAQVDLGGAEPSAEVVVGPERRRRGVGTLLLDAVASVAEAASPGAGHAVWAHGDLPEARALAAVRGMDVARELWVMSRGVSPATSVVRPGQGADPNPAGESEVAPASVPAGSRLRPFVVGADEAAWLDVNARAFAAHPEQGRVTLADLEAREREPWFRAEDLLLLVDDASGALEGFVWVKVAREDAGELYVVGVDPGSQGRGLGHVLTAAGLAHVAARGLPRALLYVDADNVPAVATYLRAGFKVTDRSVRFRTARS